MPPSVASLVFAPLFMIVPFQRSHLCVLFFALPGIAHPIMVPFKATRLRAPPRSITIVGTRRSNERTKVFGGPRMFVPRTQKFLLLRFLLPFAKRIPPQVVLGMGII